MNWIYRTIGKESDFSKKFEEDNSRYELIIAEGIEAGTNGKECWGNPYVFDANSPNETQCWHAGWCRGRQKRDKERKRDADAE